MAERATALPVPQTWLWEEDVLAVADWTDRWLRMQVAEGKVTSRPSGSHGRNGKPRREYLLSSLPAEAQIRYANLQAEKALTSLTGQAGLLQRREAPDVHDVRGEEQTELAFPRAAVADDDAGQAQARLAAIEQIVEWRGNPRAFPTPGGAVKSLNDFVAWVGAQQRPPASARTVYRWLARFDEAIQAGANPYAALADRDRSDKDKSKFFAAHPAAAAWVIAKYTAERITNLRLLHEALAREWPKLSIKDEPPSYATLRAFVEKEVPAPVRTYAHQGPDAYRNQHGPFIIRDHSQIKPMDWWVLDHRILDIDCRNTIFPTLGRDEMYRLHFTAIVDWGSRVWAGFCLSPQASWRTIGSALRMAISDYGFPKNLYWDNGEDFKKVQRMLEGAGRAGSETQDEYAEAMRVFLKGNGIEIGITRALKYNARAKQIEAMFSGVSKRFDLIWGDAYQGSSTERRSEYNEAAQKRHKKYLAGRASDSPLPADVELIAALAQYLYRENSKQRQSLEGRSRLDLLDGAAKGAAVPRRLLDVLFCERDRRKVGRGACVQLDNRRYEPATDADLLALDFYQGRDVMILRDPYCLEEAAALDPESLRFIAELRLQDFVAQSPNGHVTRDQIQACLRRERSLKRQYANYVGFFAALARSQGWQTERQVLLEEAGGAGTNVTPGAAPALPEFKRPALDSPFVDDAAAKFAAAMEQPE